MSAFVVTGTFEIHIFVMPLDPSPDVAQAFIRACRGSEEAPRMKGLLLNLDYQGKGFVGVLQSSRYVRGSLEDARCGADEDARILREAGFEVVRKKVEAVSTNEGVPRTADDAKRSPADCYFEFHLLIDRKNHEPISNEDVASLRSIATDMSTRLEQPVPLSYNALKPGQRFLNLRARGVGLDDAQLHVRELEEQVGRTSGLEVVKVISEYICFDDNLALDNGWLEPPLSRPHEDVGSTAPFVFVTSNVDKWREAERILGRALERATLDLPEIQAATTAEVALHKARSAFAALGRPVIVEDAGVELRGLGGFPGPFIKYWETAGGLASICRAADGIGDRRATAVCVLGVCAGDEAYVVEGRTDGAIADRPRGSSGFGWDAIFLPKMKGESRTWGEMTAAEKDRISHRRRAWEKLAARL